MKLITGEFEKRLQLQFAPSIRAGFPSPAEDYLNESLDFNRDLIKHPEATFYGRVQGDSMIGAGICDGDIAVIDRSIEAEHGNLSHKKDGYIELKPANDAFQPIRINEEDNFEVWGVVIWTIKKWK